MGFSNYTCSGDLKKEKCTTLANGDKVRRSAVVCFLAPIYRSADAPKRSTKSEAVLFEYWIILRFCLV